MVIQQLKIAVFILTYFIYSWLSYAQVNEVGILVCRTSYKCICSYPNPNYTYISMGCPGHPSEDQDSIPMVSSDIGNNITIFTMQGQSINKRLSITKLYNNSFITFTNVLSIRILYTKLQYLDVQTFLPCKNSLQYLELTYNQIQTLPQGIFSYIPKLALLYLHHNLLTTLDGTGIGSFTQMVSLDISYNLLKTLPNDFSSNFLPQCKTSLRMLNLSYNSLLITGLEFYDTQDTNMITSLLQLGIANCSIEQTWKTKGKTFLIEMANLEILDFGYNGFNEILLETFRSAYPESNSKLKRLYLRGNNFKSLDSYVFRILTNLELLDLSKNKISSINENAFTGIYFYLIQCIFHNFIGAGCHLAGP